MPETKAIEGLATALRGKRIRETSRHAINEFANAISQDLDGAVELLLRCHNGHVDAELRIDAPGAPSGQIVAT